MVSVFLIKEIVDFTSLKSFKADIKEVKNIQNLSNGFKLNNDLLIVEKNIKFTKKCILFNKEKIRI